MLWCSCCRVNEKSEQDKWQTKGSMTRCRVCVGVSPATTEKIPVLTLPGAGLVCLSREYPSPHKSRVWAISLPPSHGTTNKNILGKFPLFRELGCLYRQCDASNWENPSQIFPQNIEIIVIQNDDHDNCPLTTSSCGKCPRCSCKGS